jgi:hypothetical protein
MQAELEQQLHVASKEQLIRFVQQLAMRHPALQTEMLTLLQSVASDNNLSTDDEETADVTEETADVEEDWDFSGNERVVLHRLPQTIHTTAGSENVQQLRAAYATRLSEETAPDTLMATLSELLDEAINYIASGDAYAALELFALLFDERLLERHSETISIYDDMLDAAMYSLDALLSEASSDTSFNTDSATLSPMLKPDTRRRWLERLFALWLKHLDAHRFEENLPEIILDVAWHEDMLLLRRLAQNELQKQPHSEHGNILDFNRQYRTRALEKFLKELPYS